MVSLRSSLVLVAYLPIDENTTCAKRVSYRNILPLPWLDSLFRNVDYKLAHEDIVVVETLASHQCPKYQKNLMLLLMLWLLLIASFGKNIWRWVGV